MMILTASVGLFALTEYIVASIMQRAPYTITLPLSLLAIIGVTICLMICGAVVRLYHHWIAPQIRLKLSLQRVLSGEIPIDEMADAEGEITRAAGGLAPLIPAIEDLLRALRESRAEVGRLDAEMRQKVAQRTDALERRLGSLQAQASRDPLTGLLNRRLLEQFADDLVRRATAEQLPTCVIMMDLDDFKLLNDTLGHAAGDELLRSVGQLIRSSVRDNDLAFRYGGDEFVILLPDTGRAEAAAMVQRLIDLIDGLAKPLNVARKPRLSAGLASLWECPGNPTAKELLETADRTLYDVKKERKAKLKTTRKVG